MVKYNLPVDYDLLEWWERRDVRNQYISEQKNRCYYCKGDLSKHPEQDKPILWSQFPPNFLEHPIHLHHDHGTGLTIGAVHSYCNAVLWQYHGE